MAGVWRPRCFGRMCPHPHRCSTAEFEIAGSVVVGVVVVVVVVAVLVFVLVVLVVLLVVVVVLVTSYWSSRTVEPVVAIISSRSRRCVGV